MKRTPLYETQKKLGAKFTEFGGWEMPVQFSSIINEHNAVREKAGLFDASHMGEFIVSGPNAVKFLDKVTLANSGAIPAGKARYSMLLNEKGGIIDDIIIYRRPEDFFVVVNAGNMEKDFEWLTKNLSSPSSEAGCRGSKTMSSPNVSIGDPGASKIDSRLQNSGMTEHIGVKLENLSGKIGLLALQGPDAQKIMQNLVNDDLSVLKYFSFIAPSWKNHNAEFSMLARTGYTGEDGFEIFISKENLVNIWDKLLSLGAVPCGLGARDTLRLEAAMPLHGHEISEDITPLEAEMDWAIFWEKDFIGKAALLKKKQDGPSRFLVAFGLKEGIPRGGYDITLNGKKIGAVVSGTFSPTFKKGIGIGYVDRKMNLGDTFYVVIHNSEKTAVVVPKPFYKRKK